MHANECKKLHEDPNASTNDRDSRNGHFDFRKAISATKLVELSAADVQKAYEVYILACPFKKMSNLYANKMIMEIGEKATTLIIVDVGICYVFQWPCLIQRLSAQAGGPCKLRITVIEFPQPGFRPAERVEETGRRLKRFWEALFHFSAELDKFEATVDRGDPKRMMFEREAHGRDIMNAVACEGNGGLKGQRRTSNGRGWKGRVINALSCWKPVTAAIPVVSTGTSPASASASYSGIMLTTNPYCSNLEYGHVQDRCGSYPNNG
ncbi:hypothetical protein F3Y22_tig00116954pilonHSYRG00271 [Hibiscus syriacus]|uniref:Uncharacterized protein n=1 Tax=Hibiscus syriacus TaxID=106335 RepID=A0A6A2WKQ1_HIBSY|nr:hypothetical protein F3Y22_tig00116954pilonHSYRG00271 [Hibiscus syriacus]